MRGSWPCLLVGCLWGLGTISAAGADWPMWRCDAGRTGETAEQLPDQLHLQWVRQLPALKPAFQTSRLQFDRGYEPIVLGLRLFLGSSANDSLTALDTRTGRELWRFFANGPIRLAPVAWREWVYVGSDDGYLYCLNVADGSLRWKLAAVPSDRRLLGNGRLISVWPVRGGPVLHAGRLYFAAGVWPFEGVMVYAVDAVSGQVVWRNERLSYLHGIQPHGATAIGGVTPQGYLLVDGDSLIVPCGTAYPAKLDLATGQLRDFQLPQAGRVPGGWFAALTPEQRRGEAPAGPRRLTFDSQINTDRHEDDWRTGQGQPDVRRRIRVGQRDYKFQASWPGIEGEIHTLLAANERLFAVTLDGRLFCFGSAPATVQKYATAAQPPPLADNVWTNRTRQLLATPGVGRRGYALVLGGGSGQLVEALLQLTELQLVVCEPAADRSAALRERWERAGWLGTRVAVLHADPATASLPPYFASLITAEHSLGAGGPTAEWLAKLFACLRPYGGTACFWPTPVEAESLRSAFTQATLADAKLSEQDGRLQLTRPGALSGATNYTVMFQPSADQRVRAPLGVLWYDDTVGFFKRSPPPQFADGFMRAYDELWMGYPDGDRPPYKLAGPTYMDVYTGRALAADEVAQAAAHFPAFDAQQKQPNQFRPVTQKDAWNPEPPAPGERTNPLTGQLEPRRILKSYGCDGGFDYGDMFTMRSGTAAFYDKRVESGTVSISGPRSGCTNSIVPACGLLNLPYYYKGCTCSYPLPTSAALVSMPATYEQWSTWGTSGAEPVRELQRLGINFGAPGDRVSPAGTLWLDYPSVGGPSPTVDLNVEPAAVRYFYRHSIFIRGGTGWPWVAASGAEGLTRATIRGLKPGTYVVRLYFAEPTHQAAGQRLFDVAVQGRPVLQKFDVWHEAGGRLRGVVKQFDQIVSEGSLVIQCTAQVGQTLLSGCEIVAQGLTLDELPHLPDVSADPN